MDIKTTLSLKILAGGAKQRVHCLPSGRKSKRKMGTTSKKKSVIINQTSPSIQPKKVIIMRKNQKVARVSMYCKLNMLVPQLQSLSARMQTETNDKGRNNHNNTK